MENIVEDFNEIYGAAVNECIDRNKTFSFKRDGKKWYLSDNLCMRRSIYKIPNDLIELLKVGNISKPYAYTIYLKLRTKPKIMEYMFNSDNLTFLNACADCGCESYKNGYVWTNYIGTICGDCIHYTNDKYILADVTKYNSTDYLLFGKDNSSGRYYINCNIDSEMYGSVLCMVSKWNIHSSGTIIMPSLDCFIKAIHKWITYVPNNDRFLDRWNILLDSEVDKDYIPKDAIIYGFPECITYRDVVANIGYEREFSEELVQRCAELFRSRENRKRILYKRSRQKVAKMNATQRMEYAREMIKKLAGRRMFGGDIPTLINIRVRNAIVYEQYVYKSFSAYIRTILPKQTNMQKIEKVQVVRT